MPTPAAYRADALRDKTALRTIDDGQRRDATALWWSQELEQQIVSSYKVHYPELKFAEGRVIPQRQTVPRGKRTGWYKMYGFSGVSKWFTTGSWKDLNLASASGVRKSFDIHEFGVGYGWELWEVEEAAATNSPLQALELEAAKRAQAIFLEENGAFGDINKGHNGLLNHPNMTVIDAPAGAGTKYRWSTTSGTPKTGLEILADIDLIVRSMRAVSRNMARPNRIWLPPAFWERTNSLFLPNTSQNVRTTLAGNHPGVVFDELNQLEAAGNYGGPAILAAMITSPNDLWHEVPMRDEPHGPFEDGLYTKFLLRSAAGGVITPYPMQLLRMDFPPEAS